MNWRAIRALIYKDLRLIIQSRMVMMPLIIVPFIFIVVMPVVFATIMSNPANIGDVQQDLQPFMENLPANIQVELEPYTQAHQKFFYLMIVYQFAPLFLIIPLMMANVIAADSFVGEKERKTLEALIYTPTTDLELYVSKLLTAWIPALIITLLSGVIYCVVANLAGYSFMQRLFLPTPMWLILVVWVAPPAAGLGLVATVLISSKVSTFQEAYQLGGMIVLPVVALLLAQISGLFYLSAALLFGSGVVLWLVDIGLLWFGARSFQRGELIAKL